MAEALKRKFGHSLHGEVSPSFLVYTKNPIHTIFVWMLFSTTKVTQRFFSAVFCCVQIIDNCSNEWLFFCKVHTNSVFCRMVKPFLRSLVTASVWQVMLIIGRGFSVVDEWNLLMKEFWWNYFLNDSDMFFCNGRIFLMTIFLLSLWQRGFLQ